MAEMTYRQRLLGTLSYQKVDRAPDMEFFAWSQTMDRWKTEGMPKDVTNFNEYFGLDDVYGGPWIATGLCPGFVFKVLEDKGDHLIVSDADGAICEQAKVGASIPKYLKYAVESRADWEKLAAERLDPNNPDRISKNWPELCATCTDDRPFVTQVFPGSLYGLIRNWLGVERLSVVLYDDYAWVEAMMEHLTRLSLAQFEKLAGKYTIDWAIWWEDMCYNHGPLMSPAMFRDLMVPRYRRITDFLRNEFGCTLNLVDCDGNVHELAGLWLEGGVNVQFPIEVAHTDGYRLAREFGKRLAFRGGFDKRALIAGPAAIDAELARIRPLYERGGLIPHTDHLVPPDVSFENYLYYRRRKCEFIGKPWVEPRR